MRFDPSDRSALAAFARHERRGVVATVYVDGLPEAALVGLASLDDGTLIFDSPRASRKIENLRHCSRVAVVIGTAGEISVQVEGDATPAIAGDDRVRLGAAYNAQFPGSRALADGFVVVGIRPTWVRVYDATTEPPTVAEASWHD